MKTSGNKDLLELIKLMKESGKLKRVFRSGWLFVGLSPGDVESVADHTFRVALISMLLCDYIRTGEIQIKCDIEKVIRIALLHDLAEIKIGDLHLTATIYLGKENKNHAELKAFQDLMRKIHPELRSMYIGIFKEYIEEKTIEAKIVRCADIIDMLLQADYYREVGYPKEILKEFWRIENYQKICEIPILREILMLITDKWNKEK